MPVLPPAPRPYHLCVTIFFNLAIREVFQFLAMLRNMACGGREGMIYYRKISISAKNCIEPGQRSDGVGKFGKLIVQIFLPLFDFGCLKISDKVDWKGSKYDCTTAAGKGAIAVTLCGNRVERGRPPQAGRDREPKMKWFGERSCLHGRYDICIMYRTDGAGHESV